MATSLSSTQITDLCHCGHTEEQHDAVAARYCRATRDGGLSRACTCPVGERPAAHYSR